ncbi:MAG: hypothetical protein K8R40_04820 [Anaerolineaceae bacterium]|nr:hypothetical protein [Anaerolineaceae bacterium]
MKKKKLVVFYGVREIGKTTLLMKVVPHLIEQGYHVSGVLSPAVFTNGEKTGINIRNVSTGEERILAIRRNDENVQDATPGYEFNESNLSWGNEILRDAVPTDVLIVDELGPLEIKFKKGWQFGVEAVESGDYDLYIVVLREELHTLVRDDWPITDWVAFHPDSKPNCFDHYLSK